MKVLSAILCSLLSVLSVLPSVSLAQQTAAATVAVADTKTSSCAPFDGKYGGDWGYVGQRWLSVKEVGAKCVASHSTSREVEEAKLRPTKIEKDVLIIPCGTGECFFELHGEKLWARYAGPDGTGQAVFSKITEK